MKKMEINLIHDLYPEKFRYNRSGWKQLKVYTLILVSTFSFVGLSILMFWLVGTNGVSEHIVTIARDEKNVKEFADSEVITPEQVAQQSEFDNPQTSDDVGNVAGTDSQTAGEYSNPLSAFGSVAGDSTVIISSSDSPSTQITESYIDNIVRFNIASAIAARFILPGTGDKSYGCLQIDSSNVVTTRGVRCRVGGGGGGGTTEMSIGAAMTGATEGSVLFAGAGGVLAQDNSNFFFDDTTDSLTVGGDLTVTGTCTGCGGAVAWNAIAAPTGIQSLTFDDGELNSWTVSSNTETFQTITGNSLTTGTLLSASATALTTGNVIDLTLGAALTTGTAINVTSASYSPIAGSTGNLINLNFTNTTTSTGGTSIVSGINIAPMITAAGAGGTHETYSIKIQSVDGTPGAGTQKNYGIRIGNQGLSGSEISYGLYVDDQSGSNETYAAYFGGPVSVKGNGGYSSPTGVLYVQGDTASGTIASITSEALTTGTGLSIAVGTLTTGTSFDIIQTSAPGAGETSKVMNLYNRSIQSNTSSSSNVIVLNLSSEISMNGAGGTQNLYGIYLQDVYGSAGGGTQNIYGVRIGNQGYAGVETSYGLYVDNQTGATNSYTAYFGGNVGIGDTSPVNVLTVTGTASISSVLQVGQETATTYSRLGTGTTGHSLDAANDLLISDALEVDGLAYFDSDIQIGGSSDPETIDLYGSYSSQPFQILNTSNGDGVVAEFSIGGDSGYFDLYGGGNDIHLSTESNYDSYFNVAGGNFGLDSSAPDRQLEINDASGNNLRLTYNDSDGSATNYADLLTTSGGNLTVVPSGGTASITGITTISSILQVGSATATTYSRLGTGTTGHSLDAANDLFISDDLEVDGDAWFDGNVGIGTASIGYKLVVETDSADYAMRVFNDGNNSNRAGIIIQAGADDGSGTTYYLGAYDGNGDQVGYIANESGTFALTDVSDIRTKTKITNTEIDAMQILTGLRVVDFNRIQNPNGQRITGFIAQEVQEVFPNIITKGKNGYLGITKENLVPVLVKGFQDQQDQLTAMQNQINILQGNPQGNLNSNTPLVLVEHMYLSGDNVGEAKILAGGTSVRVSFSKPYQYQPIVTITPQGRVGSEYWVSDKDETGFTIYIGDVSESDLTFDWHSFAGEAVKLTVSDGSQEDVVLVVVEAPSDFISNLPNNSEGEQVLGEETNLGIDPESDAPQAEPVLEPASFEESETSSEPSSTEPASETSEEVPVWGGEFLPRGEPT